MVDFVVYVSVLKAGIKIYPFHARFAELFLLEVWFEWNTGIDWMLLLSAEVCIGKIFAAPCEKISNPFFV